MITYREWLAQTERRLSGCGIADAGADAWLLLEHGAGISRLYYSLNSGQEIPEETLRTLQALSERRCRRIPVQQLIGEAWFMGYPFRVNEHVLIPRQDTEILVEQALGILSEKRAEYARESPAQAERPLRVLDLCTGSGCVLLSILKEMPGISGIGTDISPGALAVAEENAARLGVEASFQRSDLWELVEGLYDLIVSNPPYIARDVIRSLSAEVREHEPLLALDGGRDGLDFYRRIAGRAADYLAPGGCLAVEIGYDQGEAVASMMDKNGFWDVRVIRDLAGLDRVVAGKRQR